jgi:hypothetical protein
MTSNVLLAETASGMSAALFVNGKLVMTLSEISSIAKLAEKANVLAEALQVKPLRCVLPDPLTPNWAWQDMFSQASLLAALAETSVRVAHWEAYEGDITDSAPAESHEFQIIDLREKGGKARMMLTDIADQDDMLDVYLEVTSNPAEPSKTVACAHVHIDLDDALFSAYKIGSRIMLRPNTDVRLEAESIDLNGSRETVYWLEDSNKG